jgi:hypothetical protein
MGLKKQIMSCDCRKHPSSLLSWKIFLSDDGHNHQNLDLLFIMLKQPPVNSFKGFYTLPVASKSMFKTLETAKHAAELSTLCLPIKLSSISLYVDFDLIY